VAADARKRETHAAEADPHDPRPYAVEVFK
jgi:hypothetical protein